MARTITKKIDRHRTAGDRIVAEILVTFGPARVAAPARRSRSVR